MSLRKIIATIAVATAFMAFPVIASARFSDVGPVDVHAKAQPSIPAPAADQATANDDGGTGTATVLVIAGLTLLAGAATGAGGVRIAQRRGRALQA